MAYERGTAAQPSPRHSCPNASQEERRESRKAGSTCHSLRPLQHLAQQALGGVLPPQLLLGFGQVEQRAHILR